MAGGSTSVLHLLHHFAVGVFYLLGVGDIQLEHREARGAGSSQLLCPCSVFIQNSGKHGEAQLVQVLGQSMANPRVATCKGSKQDKMVPEKIFRKETHHMPFLMVHSLWIEWS